MTFGIENLCFMLMTKTKDFEDQTPLLYCMLMYFDGGNIYICALLKYVDSRNIYPCSKMMVEIYTSAVLLMVEI